MEVEELGRGLWRWTAGTTACLYLETDTAIVLIDPIVPAEDRERFLRALDRDVERHGRPVRIALTREARRDDAQEIVERYGAEVWSPTVTTAPPAGIEPLAGAAFWIPAHRTLFAADRIRVICSSST